LKTSYNKFITFMKPSSICEAWDFDISDTTPVLNSANYPEGK